MSIRSNTSKLLFILTIICAYGPAMADQSKSNVVTVGVTGDRSLDEINLEIKNLLSKLEKLEEKHLKIIQRENKGRVVYVAKSDVPLYINEPNAYPNLRRSTFGWNVATESGLERQLFVLRDETADQIAALGEPAVPILINRLGLLPRKFSYCRRCIRTSLSRIGASAIPYIIRAVQDARRSDRSFSYVYIQTLHSAFENISDPDALELLLVLFSRNEPEYVRYRGLIASILGNIPDKRAVQPVISELEQRIAKSKKLGNLQSMTSFVKTLRLIGDKRAVAPIIDALDIALKSAQQTGDWDNNGASLMRECTQALGAWGDKRAIAVLKRALKAGPQRTRTKGPPLQPQYLVAEEAARALRSLGVQVEGKDGKYRIVDAPESAESNELRVSRILQRLYTAMEKAYADVGLSKEDIQGLLSVQQPPQEAMGKWKSYQEAWPAIVKARNAAIEQMASLGPSAVTVLLEAKDKSDERRGGDIFVYAIIKIGKTAVPALINGLSHVDVLARVRAATSLGKMRDKRAVEPLIRSLSDPDKRVVGAAVNSLGRLKDIAAIQPLMELWHKGQIVSRTSIASALGQIGDKRAAEPIMAALEECVSKAQQTGNWDMNSWAAMRVYAGALGKIGDPQAIGLLKKMLDAPPQRTKAPTPLYLIADAAARALRSLGLEVTGDREKGGYKLVETALNTEVKGGIKQERIGM
jgi:HEAT repeat protein